jgi:hypothetical protein
MRQLGRQQSQHLKAEDNAGSGLLYMRFEVVINRKDRKCTRDWSPLLMRLSVKPSFAEIGGTGDLPIAT